MIRLTITALVLLAFVGQTSADDKDDKIAEQKKLLQGRWEPTEVQVLGKKLPNEEWTQMYWEFADDKVSILVKNPQPGKADFLYRWNWAIDPSKEIAALDLTGSNPKLGFIAIYKVDGDTLTVCWNAGRETRPEKFESSKTDFRTLTTFKRVKK